MRRILPALLSVTLALFGANAFAGAVDSGMYTVRYSVVNSLQIPAAVARVNDIKRNGNTAIITITLQRPTPDNPYQAIAANVAGNARTLLGAPQPLTFRRVDTNNSVYSIAALQLANATQTVTVELEVTTADGSALIPVRFSQKLYRR